MNNNDATPLFAAERRERILVLLRERSKLTVPELSDEFHVSSATIRTDLRDLEAAGSLRRTHGGAIPIGKTALEPLSSHKRVDHIEEKRRIAMKAAELVEDGDTIALDAGTTVLELARCLVDRNDLTVVTNDVEIARYLEASTQATTVLIGGMIRRGFHCTTGPMTVGAIQGLNVDKCFLGSNAFSLEKGFTTPNVDHAEVKRALMQSAANVTMLQDSSKFGRISFVSFAGLGDIDRFITDDGIGGAVRDELAARHEELELVVV